MEARVSNHLQKITSTANLSRKTQQRTPIQLGNDFQIKLLSNELEEIHNKILI